MSVRPWRWFASLAIVACASPLPAQTLPGQPYVGYWFPDTLLSWDPATDPDAAYNRSTVPLGARFSDPAQNVNPHALADQGRVTSLVAFAPTSFNPSQGSATMDYYALNYWQYVDYLVFWGGSAGEGLILAPNPTVIDAAHRNGVPVLGNVYLPPNAFGGQIQWVHDFVQRDGDTFPVADKMIQAAEYYGFDGWFINQETSGGNAALASDMQAMLEYFQAHSSLRIVWYDSMTQTGAIAYQNALDAQNQMFFQDGSNVVSNDMFLNFNWTTGGLASSAALATTLGRSPYELYAGADVESNGYNTNVNWNGLFPEGSPHVASLGLYRPEWTFNSSSSVANFYTRDNRMWVGPNGDPSNTTTTAAWKGIANYIPATSPISTLPFVTNFNTGQGSLYALDGETMSTSEWNNLSLQDVLPTWRWIVRSSGSKLTPAMDWSESYWGGTSLKLSGTLDAVNDITLYETQLALDADSLFVIAYDPGEVGGPTHLQVGLTFADAPTTVEYLDIGDATRTGWDARTLALTAYAGRTLSTISLRVNPAATSQAYTMHIGRLGVYASPPPTPAPPTDAQLVSKNETAPDSATLRLQWSASPDPINSYNVLQRHADGSASWLGGTPNTAYFVGQLTRDGSEAASTIEIEAVGPTFVRSAAATVLVPWDSIFADGFDGAGGDRDR